MATKPKPTAKDAETELNGLLMNFADYLRGMESSLADDTPPAERAIARKGLRAYVVELERLAGNKDEPKT